VTDLTDIVNIFDGWGDVCRMDCPVGQQASPGCVDCIDFSVNATQTGTSLFGDLLTLSFPSPMIGVGAVFATVPNGTFLLGAIPCGESSVTVSVPPFAAGEYEGFVQRFYDRGVTNPFTFTVGPLVLQSTAADGRDRLANAVQQTIDALESTSNSYTELVELLEESLENLTSAAVPDDWWALIGDVLQSTVEEEARDEHARAVVSCPPTLNQLFYTTHGQAFWRHCYDKALALLTTLKRYIGNLIKVSAVVAYGAFASGIGLPVSGGAVAVGEGLSALGLGLSVSLSLLNGIVATDLRALPPPLAVPILPMGASKVPLTVHAEFFPQSTLSTVTVDITSEALGLLIGSDLPVDIGLLGKVQKLVSSVVGISPLVSYLQEKGAKLDGLERLRVPSEQEIASFLVIQPVDGVFIGSDCRDIIVTQNILNPPYFSLSFPHERCVSSTEPKPCDLKMKWTYYNGEKEIDNTSTVRIILDCPSQQVCQTDADCQYVVPGCPKVCNRENAVHFCEFPEPWTCPPLVTLSPTICRGNTANAHTEVRIQSRVAGSWIATRSGPATSGIARGYWSGEPIMGSNESEAITECRHFTLYVPLDAELNFTATDELGGVTSVTQSLSSCAGVDTSSTYESNLCAAYSR
jgi:hypothetical protein